MQHYCEISSTIKEYLDTLEGQQKAFQYIKVDANFEQSMRESSVLKSSLYSARIEGNPIENVSELDYRAKVKPKIEVQNLSTALRYIYSSKAPKKVSKRLILNLHKMVLKNLASNIGVFRSENWAIYNQSGAVVYLAPPPEMINESIIEIVNYSNSNRDHIVINSAITHYAFEKLHPLPDGNGRVGRLLSTFLLKNGGFDFKGLLALEEYIDNNRNQYYSYLELNKKNITPFVEFILEGMVIQAEKTFDLITSESNNEQEYNLLPRRREILYIIKDHPYVSFDSIQRRFMNVSKSTLHYDIKYLIDNGYIRKLGKTNGVKYEAVK